MKTGILINARLGSTRLEKKHLLPVNGKPLIHYLIERIKWEFDEEIQDNIAQIVIATSDEEENRQFAKFSKCGVYVFYGSINNIPLRHFQAATALGLDAVVSVDGDDILCSPKGMREVYRALIKGAKYVKTSNIPFGMNSFGYSFSFLTSSIRNHAHDTLETGWNHIFDDKQLIDIVIPFSDRNDALRFTLDYEEDYEFFKVLIEGHGDKIIEMTDEELVATVLNNEIFRINEPISKQYWDNFYRLQRQEFEKSRNRRVEDNKGETMMSKGQMLWEKAKTIIPGGNQLLSKRSEKFLPGLWPAYYAKAKGCEVWDLDGNHFYDFAQMGVGSCVVGYADDDVDAAVMTAIQNSSMCSLNCPEEVELAERLISLHSWADMARFCRTGGEACAVAVRIARAASGKSKVAFCGYHGWHDWYLSANLGDSSNLDGQLLPGLDPLGVPRELRETNIPFSYNNLNELENIVNRYPNEIGAIIMEPERSTSPAPGFLEGVRKIATKIGAVLIFDEVTSGFRMNLGGIHLIRGVYPDIAVFGKAMGNGYPISAIVGRKSVMESAQDTFISSTFWTERIGFTAALCTINKMEKHNVPAELVRYGELINKGWCDLARKLNLKIHISGIPPLTHIGFDHGSPLAVQTLYAQEMLERGFLLGASVYTTYAYSDKVIQRFLDATEIVFGIIKTASETGQIESSLKDEIIHGGFKRLT